MKLKPLLLWLGFGLAGLLVAFAPVPIQAAQPTEKTFRVEASSFEFSPAMIEVNPGDTVTIQLISTDVVHGLHIDGYDIAITADPGQTEQVTFVADKTGSFKLRCSVTCGALHPFMLGKLTVGSNLVFWRGTALVIVTMAAAIFINRRAGHNAL